VGIGTSALRGASGEPVAGVTVPPRVQICFLSTCARVAVPFAFSLQASLKLCRHFRVRCEACDLTIRSCEWWPRLREMRPPGCAKFERDV